MADNVVVSPLNKGGATLFDKLQHLSSEISEGIVNLSGGKRWLVDMELQHLKEEAQKETSPEATYNLLLFRKYADVANQIKDENAELKTQGVSFPSILPEAGNDEKLLRGLDAMRSNLFWLRVLAALLSFVSFVVMSTVPHVQHAHFHPNSYFEDRYCPNDISGFFNMRPYQFVIVCGVLVYLHTLVTSLYYLLPVDDDNQKYIPGLKGLVRMCVDNAEEAEATLVRVANWFRPLLRAMEFTADLCLVLLCAVAFVTAAASLEAPVRFEARDTDTVAYYSLPAFYLTFSSAQPCIDDEDTVAKIRSSLAMLFLVLCVMLLCLHVSWRNLHKEVTHRQIPQGGSSMTDIGSRGIHMEEGRESFLAAPLRTSSEHGSGGQGSDDEEVAVTFNYGGRLSSPSKASASTSTATPQRGPATGGQEEHRRDASGAGGNSRPAEELRHPAEATARSSADPGSDAPRAVTPGSAGTGKGRGAALMRRYEGHQFKRAVAAQQASGRQAPAAGAGAGAAEAGSGTEDEEGEGKFEEMDL